MKIKRQLAVIPAHRCSIAPFPSYYLFLAETGGIIPAYSSSESTGLVKYQSYAKFLVNAQELNPYRSVKLKSSFMNAAKFYLLTY